MGIGSIWHWIIVLLIVMLLFGRGRISEMMGDFGKGISSFKKGLSETEETPAQASARIEPPAPAAAQPETPAPAEKTDTTGA